MNNKTLTKITKQNYNDDHNKNVYYYEVTDKNGEITGGITQGFKSKKSLTEEFENKGKLPKLRKLTHYTIYLSDDFELNDTSKISTNIEKKIRKLNKINLENKKITVYFDCQISGTSENPDLNVEDAFVEEIDIDEIEDQLIAKNTIDSELQVKMKLLKAFMKENVLSKDDILKIV